MGKGKLLWQHRLTRWIAFPIGFVLLWFLAPASPREVWFIIAGALLAFVITSAWYCRTIETLLIGISRLYIRRASKEGLRQAFDDLVTSQDGT